MTYKAYPGEAGPIWEVSTQAFGMCNSSVEAMQDFGSLLRKPPAGLLVMLRIDEYSAPNRGVYFVRSRLAIKNVSLRSPNNESVALESEWTITFP